MRTTFSCSSINNLVVTCKENLGVLILFFGICRYSLIGMREHIKKRPPLATTEKVQQFVRVRDLSHVTALYSS